MKLLSTPREFFYHWYVWFTPLKLDYRRKQTPFAVVLVWNCPKNRMVLPAGPQLHSPQELHRQTEPGRACWLRSVWPAPSLEGRCPAFARQCRPAPRQMPGYGLEGRSRRRRVSPVFFVLMKESHLRNLPSMRIQHTVSYRLHGDSCSILPIALLIELDHRLSSVPLWRV